MSDFQADDNGSKAVKSRIHGAIQNEAPGLAEKQNAMLSGWLLVTEWIDEDGQRWMAHMGDDESPAWTRMGFLKAAMLDEEGRWQ